MATYAINKKARHDYEILDTLEAGLVLTGQETKSIRTGSLKLSGAFITFHKEKPMLTNLHIPRYKYASTSQSHDPERPKELLLSKKQIDHLRGKLQEKGLTIVPLSVYNKGRYIKVEIGIGKGKKTYDKRRVIKKRELDKEVSRAIKYSK